MLHTFIATVEILNNDTGNHEIGVVAIHADNYLEFEDRFLEGLYARDFTLIHMDVIEIYEALSADKLERYITGSLTELANQLGLSNDAVLPSANWDPRDNAGMN